MTFTLYKYKIMVEYNLDRYNKTVEGEQMGVIVSHKNTPIDQEMQGDIIDMIDEGILILHLLKINKPGNMPKEGDLFYLSCGVMDIWKPYRALTCGYVKIYGRNYCSNCLNIIKNFGTDVIGYIGVV